MPQLTDVGRVGRDAELRFTPNGDPLINLALACDYGRKGQDGKKPTQWVDLTIWGKQAEALTPYLVKGQQVQFIGDDAHIEIFKRSDGTEGSKLVARAIVVKLVGSAPQSQGQQQSQPQRQQAPRQQQNARQQPQQQAPTDYDSFDDDIPFADPYRGFRSLII